MDTFVKIEMSAQWLTKAITRKINLGKGHSTIKMCPMYNVIRNAMNEAIDPPEAAVAAAADIAQDDPMAEMDIVALENVASNGKGNVCSERYKRQK